MSRLDQAYSIADLRRIAQRRLPQSVFEFYDGGAEDELTLADNRAAFERRRIAARVLRDVSAPSTTVELLGALSRAPLVIAPMGSCALGWPQADLAIARAAKAAGIPYTLSTMSTVALERVAREVGGRLWFQLYVLKNQAFTDQLVTRALDAGFEALVVTVDLPVGGKRERDLRNGLTMPMRFGAKQIVQALQRPGWLLQIARHGLPEFENVRGLIDEKSASLTIAAGVGQNLDATFDWAKLARLRERWPKKLLVKGVLHAADAVKLVELGVDGIWISNHGGRQLDGAIASYDALPAIAAAVNRRVPLLLDSGVRRGVDILKAVADGAAAVAVGRAALFGVCAGGEAGAARAIAILQDELGRAMMLSGVRDITHAAEELGEGTLQ